MCSWPAEDGPRVGLGRPLLPRLCRSGDSVVVIEHNLEVIKTADWIVDLGPEGGDAGGHVVAIGTPEEIAANAKSYTGHISSRCSSAGANRSALRKPRGGVTLTLNFLRTRN